MIIALFRDHEPADLEAFCAMEAAPEVRRFGGGAPRTRDAAEKKFRSVYLPPVNNRTALWATVFKPDAHSTSGTAASTRIAATVEAGHDAPVHILRKLGFSWQRLEPGERRSYDHFELLPEQQ